MRKNDNEHQQTFDRLKALKQPTFITVVFNLGPQP